MSVQEAPHTHDPAHPHDHAHPHERGHVVEEAAVLDIGGAVGALLVQCTGDLEGAEIQLYDSEGGLLTHTEVHRRMAAGRATYAGLFPALTAGQYRVEVRPGEQRRPVRVTGGRVAVLDAR